MQRVNIFLTIGLAAVSVVFWWLVAVQPGSLMISYEAVQVPLGTGLLGLTGLGWVMVWWTDRTGSEETRCRRCRYILRGLREPRCPECGEQI